MLVFDPLTLLMWIILISFIPGTLVSISLLKKTEFWLIEKILIGSALGLVLNSSIPFILFLVGISYSYNIAIASTIIFYLIAIGLLVWTKTYEGIKSFFEGKVLQEALDLEKNWAKYAKIIALVIILYITFIIRIQTFSPIHYELDPYYYIYESQQILILGGAPLEDNTAWWPEVTVDHRAAPLLAYMEATWYSFYTQGGEYNNYLLAVISSTYPPLAALFAVFFIYLFVAANYRREYGLIAAGVATFLPTFVMKLSAGIMEVQPYAFFGLGFFVAMYAWTLKERSKTTAIITGIAYAALALGSASESLATAILILVMPIHSILLFIKTKSTEIKEFAILNLIIIAVGVIFGSVILEGLYQGGYSISKTVLFSAILLFIYVLHVLKKMQEEKKLDAETTMYYCIGILLIAIAAFAFTPMGTYLYNAANAGLGIAKYNVPLDRTIAEQPPAGADFRGSLGFLGFVPKDDEISSIIIKPISLLTNIILSKIYALVNAVLNVGLVYDFKSASLLLMVILLSFISILYSLYRSIKHEHTNIIIYAAILAPTMLIGLLKLKYVIYLGFALAPMVGVIFGESELALNRIVQKFTEESKKKNAEYILAFLLILGIAFVVLQYLYGGIAPTLIAASSTIRFEENPAIFKEKFSSLCNQFAAAGVSETKICELYAQAGIYLCSASDEDVCIVAQDPTAYSNKGINEQYNKKLCYYSLIGNMLQPNPQEISIAQFKCNSLSDYWIESMEWIRNNTEQDARITSWWDYGHWINFFGQRNTVLRNEHSSKKMIGEVAKGYLNDTPEELAKWMKEHGSKYALFDVEINGIQGGKYHALNYLSCAHMNETNVSKGQLESLCEYEHLWETVYIPKDTTNQQCTISTIENKTGILAYGLVVEKSGDIIKSASAPVYCLGQTMLANSQKTLALYYLNEKYQNGDLKLNKAFLQKIDESQDAHVFVTKYTKESIWLENGEVKSGWENRKGKYYDSNLYQAFFLEDLPGFTLVFESKGGEVKIFKLTE